MCVHVHAHKVSVVFYNVHVLPRPPHPPPPPPPTPVRLPGDGFIGGCHDNASNVAGGKRRILLATPPYSNRWHPAVSHGWALPPRSVRPARPLVLVCSTRRRCRSLCLSLSHTQRSHTDRHSRTRPLSHSFSLSHTHTGTPRLARTLSHSRSHTLFHSRSRTLSLSHSLARAHSHSHSHTLSLSLALVPSLSLFPGGGTTLRDAPQRAPLAGRGGGRGGGGGGGRRASTPGPPTLGLGGPAEGAAPPGREPGPAAAAVQRQLRPPAAPLLHPEGDGGRQSGAAPAPPRAAGSSISRAYRAPPRQEM